MLTPLFSDWLAQPWTRALGLSLLHFLWQGSLVALGAAVLLATLRRASPATRYAVACGALLTMVALPAATAAWLMGSGAVSAPIAVTISTPSATAGAWTWASLAWWVQPYLVPAWMAGVLVLSLRLLGGWVQAQRLRVRGTREARPAWREQARRLSLRMKIDRPVRVLESALVDGPVALGWIKPVVLLPPAALAGLSPRQLELVLAHELAHVRRHDYLVNLLQSVAETLLFYHPGVWWISRRIRVEREHCADDLAVSMCGDPLSLARALTVLEEARSATRVRLAAAATDGSLLDRVTRLLGVPGPHRRSPAGWAVGVVAVALVAAVGAQVERVEAAEAEPEAAPEPLVLTETDEAGDETEIVYGAPLVEATVEAPPDTPPPPVALAPAPPPTVPVPATEDDDATTHVVIQLSHEFEEDAEEWERYAEEWERYAEEWERYAEELEFGELEELEKLGRKLEHAKGKRAEKIAEEMERVAEEWAEEHEERLERMGEEIESQVEVMIAEQGLQLRVLSDHADPGVHLYHYTVHGDAEHLEHEAEALERQADELERQADELRRQAEEMDRLAEEEADRAEEEQERAREEREQAREEREQEREERLREREEREREREEERREREEERREREEERREQEEERREQEEESYSD